MLNAVNLVLVTADATVRAELPAGGQVFALFVIVLAAAEVGVGLALILQLYRLRASVAVDEIPLDRRTPTRAEGGRDVGGRRAAGGTAGRPRCVGLLLTRRAPGRRHGARASAPRSSRSGCAVALAVDTSVHSGPIVGGWRLVDFGGLPVTASVRVGSGRRLVAVAVTVVAAAVQVYSVGVPAHTTTGTRRTPPRSRCSPPPCCSWSSPAT